VTIFLEKNKRGEPTGVWLVEVRKMTAGVSKTVRRRTRDYAEAKRIEASLRGSLGEETRSFSPPVNIPPFKARTNLPSLNLKPSAEEDSFIHSGSGSGIDITKLDTSPKIFTLKDLFAGAQEIYRGTKDEKQSIARLHSALAVIGWETDVQEVRTAALDFLVRMLRSRGLSPGTINRHLYAVSAALRWALSRELIPGMPPIPKQGEPTGRLNYLTEKDQARLIEWLREHDFEDVSFATRVLLITGFRISEYLNLKQDNIRGEWAVLHEGTTKNDERRTVFIGDIAPELSARVKAGLPTYQRIAKGLSAASSALPIEPRVTPHVLRHSCATMLTTGGVSLATVGRVLGHKSLSTTMRYAHTEDQALIDAAKRLGVRSKSSK
jgi:integrase